MNNWFVYVHINKINNKKYVGQSVNLKARWKSNGYYYQDSPYFYAAIQKYGWDNFEHIILKQNLTQEEANYWEEYYITDFYKSNIRQNGYNLKGGGGGLGKPNQATLNKMSQAQKKRYSNMTQEERQKIKQNCKKMKQIYLKNATKEDILKDSQPGRIAANQYWKNHREEQKQHMDKMRKIAVEKTSKAVYCIETKQIYPSSQAAARALGKQDGSHIRKSCRNNGETKGFGYHWRFVKDIEELINLQK